MTTESNHLSVHDAKQRERSKSAQEHAEDVAYTVNHAISCGATDIFVQPVAATVASALAQEELMPKWLRWVTHLFEHHHDHGHGGHAHAHAHDASGGATHTHHSIVSKGDWFDRQRPKEIESPRIAEDPVRAKWQRVGKKVREQLRPGNFFHNLKHWALGETVGDAGGIIPTILVQRFFPGFMDGMRQKLEPVVGGGFRNGAKRDARNWGKRHGLAPDAPEVKEKEAYLYEHELSHLPQAVVWNVFSIPMNFGAQFLTRKRMPGVSMAKHAWEMLPSFIIGKGFGTFFSNGILLGGRAVAPDTFIKWDRWNSEHVIKPVLNTIGIDKETADRVTAGNVDAPPVAKRWEDRVVADPAEAEPARTPER